MVRLKNRHLLVHILNPTIQPTSTSTAAPASTSTLPPSVQFHPPAPSNLTPALLASAIKAEIASLYGDYGSGMTGGTFSIKYFSPATATFILRVSRDHYRLVWSALACLTRLPPEGAPCVMRVVRVSGTIRKSVEEAVRRARVGMERARLDGQSDRTREMGITGMAGVNGDGDGDGDEDEDGSEGE